MDTLFFVGELGDFYPLSGICRIAQFERNADGRHGYRLFLSSGATVTVLSTKERLSDNILTFAKIVALTGTSVATQTEGEVRTAPTSENAFVPNPNPAPVRFW